MNVRLSLTRAFTGATLLVASFSPATLAEKPAGKAEKTERPDKTEAPEKSAAPAPASESPKDGAFTPAQIFDSAQLYYSIGRFDKTLDALDQLTGDAAKDVNVLFLRGNTLAQVKCWAESRTAYESLLPRVADENDPKWNLIRFNLAEVCYVLKDYKAALAQFSEIYVKKKVAAPDKDRASQFIRYKMFLCNLLLGQPKDGDDLLATFSEFDDTPAWYYATAAQCFVANDAAKGWEWIASARRIYAEDLNATFFDGLYEGDFVAKEGVPKPTPNPGSLNAP